MSLGRNAAVNLAGAIVSSLVGIITIPLYLKSIGPDRFGILAVAWLFLSTFGFLDFGLTRATQYRVASNGDRNHAGSAKTVVSALVLCTPIAVIGFALIWAAITYFFSSYFKSSGSLRSEILDSAFIIAAGWPVVLFSAVINGALLGRQLFVFVNISTVASSILFQVVPLIMSWYLGPELETLLIAALVGRALPMLFLVPTLYNNLMRGFVLRFSKAEARSLLGYGGWASLTTVVATVLMMADRFLIGALLGPVAVTIYTAPLQLAQRVSLLPSALAGALFPRLPNAAPEERAGMQIGSLRAVMASLTLMIGIGLLFAAPFLDAWLGKAIGGPATPVAYFLFFGAWWNALAIISFSGLQASGRPKASAIVQAAQVLPFLVALYLGVKWAGVAGCAAVYLVRSAIDFGLLTWQSNLLRDMVKPVAVCALALALAALIGMLYRFSVPAWLVLTLCWSLVLAACSFWALPVAIQSRIKRHVGHLKARYR